MHNHLEDSCEYTPQFSALFTDLDCFVHYLLITFLLNQKIKSSQMLKTIYTKRVVLSFFAAITNYHTLSDLMKHKFIVLHFQRSEFQPSPQWLKSRCSRTVILCRGSKQELISLQFPASRDFPHSLAHCLFH